MRWTHDQGWEHIFSHFRLLASSFSHLPKIRQSVQRAERHIELLEDRSLMTANPIDILITAPPTDNWTVISPVTLPSVTGPTGPAGVAAPGEVFDPGSAGITFGNTPGAGTPIIAEWTRTAEGDESISITGDNFSSFQGKKTRFFVFADSGAGPGRIFEATTQSIQGDNRAIITLPKTDLPTNAMYMLWAVDDDGASRPVFVNRTETWWIGPDAGQAGQRISVFGRNLSRTGQEWILGTSAGAAPASVWITPQAGGTAVQVTVTAVNPYRVEFELPANLASGNYRAWVHNGKGGSYGWGTPLDFTVRSAAQNGTQWTGPVFDQTNTAELAQILTNGTADDSVLIQEVLRRAAQTPYSTVVLPTGTFYCDNFINVPSRVRLVGQGMNQTTLQARPNANFNSIGLIYSDDGGRQSVGTRLENLTLHSGYNPLGPTDPAYTGGIDHVLRINGQSDMSFSNVRFDGRAGSAVSVQYITRVRFESCEFYGSTPLYSGYSRQVFVDNCDFYLTNTGLSAISTWSANQLSITRSRAQSLNISDPTRSAQWGMRLYVNGFGARHTYIAHNTTRNLGLPPNVIDNAGEQLLWEAATAVFAGRVASATATTVTLQNGPTASDFSTGRYYITVVQGQGVGQNVRVTGATVVGTQMVLTLETPLAVGLDSTSDIEIMWLSEKCVVYGNDLGGLRENVERDAYIGTSGIMFFNGTSNMIVDANQFSDIRRPVAIYSYTTNVSPEPRYETAMHNYVANNQIRSSRYGIVIYSYGGIDTSANVNDREKSGLLGNVFRNNNIDGTEVSAFDVAYQRRNGMRSTGELVENLIIEHNTFVNTPIGIQLSLGLTIDYRGVIENQAIVRDALVYKNTITRRTATPTTFDPGSKGIIVGMGQSPYLIENTITGFDQSVAGDVPVVVRKTGQPNEFTFTLSGRELDRKGGQFWYSADFNGDGFLDVLPDGTNRITAGDAYTFTRTITNPGINPWFRIQTVGDNFFYDYYFQRWGDTYIPVESSPISVALLAGPTANAREYSFTAFVDQFSHPGEAVNIGFDWNGDGDFADPGETRSAISSATWTYTFANAGPSNIYYRVWNDSGEATSGILSINSARRDVIFEGSDREDWVQFREGTNRSVSVDITRVHGRAANFSQTFGSISGWIQANGYAGPDLLDGSRVNTIGMYLVGGMDSDTILGGGSNDQIFGGASPAMRPIKDAPNFIQGGGGQNTISAASETPSAPLSFAQAVDAPQAGSFGTSVGGRFDAFSFGSILQSAGGPLRTTWQAAVDASFSSLLHRSVPSPARSSSDSSEEDREAEAWSQESETDDVLDSAWDAFARSR